MWILVVIQKNNFCEKVYNQCVEDLLIGTSGYDYPEWKGIFYPEDLPRKDFLTYYSLVFNALEINNTFYNMPVQNRLLSFYERTEGRVKFSVKANNLLTHKISLEWKNAAEDFKNAVTVLKEKAVLSAVLFQFPESFHYIPDNRIYLSELIKTFEGFPVVIEFRHKEWIKESVFEGLEKRGTGIVFCDMPQLKNLPDGLNSQTPFIGKNAYIRLHGRNEKAWYCANEKNNGSERYCYDYSKKELEEFVPVIKAAKNEGRVVQVYFNNHPNGSGAKNAKMLKEIL